MSKLPATILKLPALIGGAKAEDPRVFSSIASTLINRTSSYKKMYGENENFVSWGPEDVERYVRAVKMGLKVARVPSYIFHLEHPRGSDSSKENPQFE